MWSNTERLQRRLPFIPSISFFIIFFGERFVLLLFLFFDNQTGQAANLASGVKIINITFAITGELTVAVNSSYGFTGSYSQLLTHIIN